ncbi:MAG: ABC transporter permease [Spirochaetales bacterium]|nr:ABC transporter permease [Spirochaetales bacterium]
MNTSLTPRLNLNLVLGFSLVGFLALLTLVSFVYLPYDVNEMNAAARYQGPSAGHWLGTDNFGRDILSRVMHGGRTAFLVGTLAVSIGLFFGTLVGGTAGYLGGWVDELFMRLMDGLLAFPGLITALIVIALVGPGTFNTAIAIGIMSVPAISRIARSGFLQYKTIDFVQAARTIGVPTWQIMFRHILPNVASSLVIAGSLTFGGAILTEASLSYLGLGVQLPDPSWGRMLREAQGYFTRNPWATLGPGIAITLMVLGFYLLGNGTRDALQQKESHL